MAVFTSEVRPTPFWPRTRLVLPSSSGAEPPTWRAMAARFTGVHRAQPALATLIRSTGSSTVAAAPFTPTAPMRDPPNQAASPSSCAVRARVFVCGMGRGYPSRPAACVRAGDGAGAPPGARYGWLLPGGVAEWLRQGPAKPCTAGSIPAAASQL